MSNIHPLLVHFPVALLTVSFFFDMAGLRRGRADYLTVGWWTMLVGVAGLLLSLGSGLHAEDQVVITGDGVAAFERHKSLAFWVIGVFSTLFLWRVAKRSRIPDDPRWLFVALYCAGVILLWAGAWAGGEMVYRYGIGVR